MFAKKLFFSYGRDPHNPQHIDIVEKIKQQLVKEGFNVFMDVEQLRGGDDWEEKLEIQIRQSDSFVFFVTPYAARKPDGYCLNELAYALSLNKKIIPLMISFEPLPLSICRLQYIDLRNVQTDQQLVSKIEQVIPVLNHTKELWYEGEKLTLLNILKPLKNSSIVSKHIHSFIGREWLYDQVDQWLIDQTDSRLLWITAEPGYGKTALSTYLSARHPSAISVYYCLHDTMETKNPSNLLRTLLYELSTQIDELARRLLQKEDLQEVINGSAPQIFREVFLELLSDTPKPEKDLFFIIDALDEAKNSDTKNEIVDLIANYFDELPEWLNIVMTSRPEPELLRKLKKLNPIELGANEQDNMTDCRTYVQDLIPNLSADKIEALVNKSEGNMLYLKNILSLDNVKLGNFTFEGIEELPEGMEGFYQLFFERKFDDIREYEKEYLDFVSVLVASEEGMPVKLLMFILDINDRALKQIMEDFGSLLLVNQNLITFYHKSLFDWLKDYEKSGGYSVDIEVGNKLIASKTWEIYKNNNLHLEYLEFELYLLLALSHSKDWKKIYEVIQNISFIGICFDKKIDYLLQKVLTNTILNTYTSTDKNIDLFLKYKQFYEKYRDTIVKYNGRYFTAKQIIYQLSSNNFFNYQIYKISQSEEINFSYLKLVNKQEVDFSTDSVPLETHNSNVKKHNFLELTNKSIVSYAEDIKIWDRNGHLLKAFQPHKGTIRDVFTLSNNSFVSYDDYAIKLWSHNGKLLQTIQSHLGTIRGAFSLPNNNFVSYDDNFIKQWDENGLQLLSLSTHANKIKKVISISGQRLVSIGRDQRICVWNQNGNEYKIFKGHTKGIHNVFEFNNKLISYAGDKTLRISDLILDNEISVVELNFQIQKVIQMPENKLLVYGNSKTIYSLNLDGKIIQEYNGHRGRILEVIIFPDGKIVSYATDKKIIIWDNCGTLLRELKINIFIFDFQIINSDTLMFYSLNKSIYIYKLSESLLLAFNPLNESVDFSLVNEKLIGYNGENLLIYKFCLGDEEINFEFDQPKI